MLFGSKENETLVEKIVNEFSTATGLAAVVVDIQGKESSQLHNFVSFCSIIRQNPKYRKLCQKCDLFGGLEASKIGEPFIYKCHAGLIDLSFPIIIKNQLSGFLLSGQVLCEDDDKQFPYVYPTKTDWTSYPELVEARKEVPAFTAKQLLSSASMLKIISNYYLKTELEVERPTYEVEMPTNDQNEEIKKALKYIDKNLHGPITLEEVSSHVFLSTHYFSKLFKREMGVNFVKYVNQRKMDLAKEMLSSTQFSIETIARNLGFNQTSYFCKLFKQRWDYTPRTYRDKIS